MTFRALLLGASLAAIAVAAEATPIAVGTDLPYDVMTNAQLAALPAKLHLTVTRIGFTTPGDAPPLRFFTQSGTCASHGLNNDGGSCVDAVDVNSWKAAQTALLDWRNFGGSYPFTLHVSATGNDLSGQAYCDAAHPCRTAQQAVTQACLFDFRHMVGNKVSIDGVFNDAGISLSGECGGQGGPQLSGQYLIVEGRDGSGSVTLNAISGSAFNVEASSGALLLVRKMSLAVASGNFGVFAQNAGTVIEVGDDLKLTGATGAFAGIYAEGQAEVEMATTQTLTLQGAFHCAMQANSQAIVEQDPGPGTTSTGTGLTIPSGGAFLCPQGGFIEWGWSTVAGAGATGDLIVATLGGRVAYFNSPPDPPGNGRIRLNAGTLIENADGSTVYPPHLGACANGTMRTTSTNYDGAVDFSGANSSCAIVFGKAATASSYFAATPTCVLTQTGPATAMALSSFSTAGFTASGNPTSLTGQAMQWHCAPPNGG